MPSTARDIPTKVWDALASLRLTMFVLIALALVSIIGTIIPQGNLDPQYIAAIGGQQGNRYRLYSLLGFFNMYHSWWFLGLLGLLIDQSAGLFAETAAPGLADRLPSRAAADGGGTTQRHLLPDPAAGKRQRS